MRQNNASTTPKRANEVFEGYNDSSTLKVGMGLGVDLDRCSWGEPCYSKALSPCKGSESRWEPETRKDHTGKPKDGAHGDSLNHLITRVAFVVGDRHAEMAPDICDDDSGGRSAGDCIAAFISYGEPTQAGEGVAKSEEGIGDSVRNPSSKGSA